MTDALLPASIRDASSEALAELLRERWDALPVERVLVWHVASTVESALPWLADTFGLSDVRYVDAPPREWLRQAIAFMRARGTRGMVPRVLEALGVDFYQVLSDTVFRYNGEFNHDGLVRRGVDAHWSTFIVFVLLDGEITDARVREIWDAVAFARPRRSRFVLLVAGDFGGGETAREYRESP